MYMYVELHEVISQLTTENKESVQQVAFLKSENEKLKNELEKNVSVVILLFVT